MFSTVTQTTYWKILVLAPAIAVLFALLTGPFVVRCITAEGQPILELLGHDPHHHARSESGNGGGSSLDSPNCTDMYLNTCAVLHAGANSKAPALCMSAAPNIEAENSSSQALPSARISSAKTAHHCPVLPLRI